MAAIKVVIADDHAIWRSGLRADLGENFTVVGEAGDAREAVEVIAATDPDLVLSNLHVPKGGGIALAKAVSDRVPVVMLTVSEAESDLLDAIAAGALGYLVKSTPPDELREREVLQLVARGHTYKEIGQDLFISAKTVENHVRNILKKTPTQSETGARPVRTRSRHRLAG